MGALYCMQPGTAIVRGSLSPRGAPETERGVGPGLGPTPLLSVPLAALLSEEAKPQAAASAPSAARANQLQRLTRLEPQTLLAALVADLDRDRLLSFELAT